MKEVTVYKCDYCSAIREDKESMIVHEDGCLDNPKNRACETCSECIDLSGACKMGYWHEVNCEGWKE